MASDAALPEQPSYGVVVTGMPSQTYLLTCKLIYGSQRLQSSTLLPTFPTTEVRALTPCHKQKYSQSDIGRTIFRRLHLVASCSTVLAEEAARMAVIEAKKGSDVRNYHQAVALLKRVSAGRNLDNLLDPAWAAQQEKKNNGETARLENELKGYKNNLIKESIRVSADVMCVHTYVTDKQSRWGMKI